MVRMMRGQMRVLGGVRETVVGVVVGCSLRASEFGAFSLAFGFLCLLLGLTPLFTEFLEF